MIRQHRPDGAVLDVIMPKFSGLAVYQMLRADADLRHIDVIIMSANPSEADARLVGTDRFLSKPFRLGILVMAINDLVRRQSVDPNGDVAAAGV